jgi:hypothetical protein
MSYKFILFFLCIMSQLIILKPVNTYLQENSKDQSFQLIGYKDQEIHFPETDYGKKNDCIVTLKDIEHSLNLDKKFKNYSINKESKGTVFEHFNKVLRSSTCKRGFDIFQIYYWENYIDRCLFIITPQNSNHSILKWLNVITMFKTDQDLLYNIELLKYLDTSYPNPNKFIIISFKDFLIEKEKFNKKNYPDRSDKLYPRYNIIKYSKLKSKQEKYNSENIKLNIKSRNNTNFKILKSEKSYKFSLIINYIFTNTSILFGIIIKSLIEVLLNFKYLFETLLFSFELFTNKDFWINKGYMFLKTSVIGLVLYLGYLLINSHILNEPKKYNPKTENSHNQNLQDSDNSNKEIISNIPEYNKLIRSNTKFLKHLVNIFYFLIISFIFYYLIKKIKKLKN